MTKSFKLGAVAAIAALALAGCGAAPEASSGSTEPASGAGGQSGQAAGSSEVKACMVSDEGGFDDRSFNESGKEGMDRAGQELGVEVKFAESTSDGDYQTNVDAMIQDGCTLIVGVGYKLAITMAEAAQANPDIQFALVDSQFQDAQQNPIELENGRPLIFNTAEAAFLAGYVAAGTTTSGTVATYGGMEIPTVQIFMEGFAKGVEKYNEDNGSAIQVLGWDTEKKTGSFVGDFSSIDKGQTLTEGFISQGADIIMPVAGPIGSGTLSAINAAPNKSELKAVWVDADGHESGGDPAIFTSVVKEIGNAVFDTVKDAKDGNFSSTPYIGNLKNKGVAMAPFYDMDSQVSQELKDKVEELKQQIVDGSLDVSTQYDPAK